MPLYEYKCAKCGNRFEKIESFSAPEKKKCPKCGGKAERTISAAAIQFKGSGWYVTDYAKKSGLSSPEGSADSGSKSAEKTGDGAAAKPDSGEKKSTESKTASESKAAPESKSSSEKPASAKKRK